VIDAVAVVIPARDEQARLPGCLHSVAAAVAALPTDIEVVTVVAADSCTDTTVAVAASHADRDPRVRVLPGRWGTVGAARRAGVEVAEAHLNAPPPRTWLAATDADTQVPEDWLTRHLELAAAGWHAVAGVVRLAGADPRLEARFLASYPVLPDEEHPYVHGANLGVRADAYAEVGGWPTRSPTGEDQKLWDAVRASGRPAVASPASVVATSARLRSRAPKGFAARLRELSTERELQR
jgi:glycosyltransferase involved in cell wall biosynthesis